MDQTRGRALETVGVLIVDDQVFFTQMLQSALEDEVGIEVVGVAHDGDTAIRLAREKAPDAVLMDIELAGAVNGIEAGKRIKRERPQTGIVILSLHSDRRYVTSLPLNPCCRSRALVIGPLDGGLDVTLDLSHVGQCRTGIAQGACLALH